MASGAFNDKGCASALPFFCQHGPDAAPPVLSVTRTATALLIDDKRYVHVNQQKVCIKRPWPGCPRLWHTPQFQGATLTI